MRGLKTLRAADCIVSNTARAREALRQTRKVLRGTSRRRTYVRDAARPPPRTARDRRRLGPQRPSRSAAVCRHRCPVAYTRPSAPLGLSSLLTSSLNAGRSRVPANSTPMNTLRRGMLCVPRKPRGPQRHPMTGAAHPGFRNRSTRGRWNLQADRFPRNPVTS